jgi:hypothetical protein
MDVEYEAWHEQVKQATPEAIAARREVIQQRGRTQRT